MEQVGYNLVSLIEAGKMETPEMEALLREYMQPMIEANIDYLVLGCSHYPYLVPQIRKILPESVTIIDSGEPVARHTKAVLKLHGLLNEAKHNAKQVFYANDTINVLQSIVGDAYLVQQKDF